MSAEQQEEPELPTWSSQRVATQTDEEEELEHFPDSTSNIAPSKPFTPKPPASTGSHSCDPPSKGAYVHTHKPSSSRDLPELDVCWGRYPFLDHSPISLDNFFGKDGGLVARVPYRDVEGNRQTRLLSNIYLRLDLAEFCYYYKTKPSIKCCTSSPHICSAE